MFPRKMKNENEVKLVKKPQEGRGGKKNEKHDEGYRTPS